ncbi:MAG: tagatose 1,6-diphosphate aldolase GatY/KbaY [Pyrinomonadaceae bacterium]|jgi:ketose-bisphosphate aldolase|nr:tagatose 1,6-diphosphate aldolase GatY/KbaY [Pyrinomonadaceae bacterium]
MPRKIPFPIIAFNFNDQFDLQGIVLALNNGSRPGVLMLSMGAIEFSGLEYLVAMFQAAKSVSEQELYLELDHCHDLAMIRRCADLGFDLIMADFSSADFKRNVEFTREAADIAHAKGALLEGELGVIPVLTSTTGISTTFTDVDQAQEFIAATQIDLFAPSVGNFHGVLQSKPSPNIDHIRTLADRLATPMVLHGSDFLTNETLGEAIDAGMAKINFGPELRAAYVESLASSCETTSSFTDHRPILRSAIKTVAARVTSRLEILGVEP